MRRSLRSLVQAFLVTGTLTLASAATSRAEPFVPRNDGDVLERLPVAPLDPTATCGRRMAVGTTRQPGAGDEAAWLYIEQGRALSDPLLRLRTGRAGAVVVGCRTAGTCKGAARHYSSTRPRFPRRARRRTRAPTPTRRRG
jgi:hypothetical protein